MSYEALARKYRPKNFKEVVGQQHVIQTIENSIKSKKILQSIILSGTRGVGKTTIARIIAKCLNCSSNEEPTISPCGECLNCKEVVNGRSFDFLEFDAATNTGVDAIRNLLNEVEYKPSNSRFKVYLIDEVHMLSTSSFNALLKTLEEPPKHVIFIFATTEMNKIPLTVKSRCIQLNLRSLSEEEIFSQVSMILNKENIKFDEESLSLIANYASGSVRDALTFTDQIIAFGDGMVSHKFVEDFLGLIDKELIFQLIKEIIKGDGIAAFSVVEDIKKISPDVNMLLKEIMSFLHQVSLHQILGTSSQEHVKDIANQADESFVQLLYEIASKSYEKIEIYSNAQECIEICILRMIAFNPLLSVVDESSNSKEIKKKLTTKSLNVGLDKKIQKKIKKDNSNLLFETHKDWNNFFSTLKLSPFTRNYFGNLSFSHIKANNLFLKGEKEQIDIPERAFNEFLDACSKKINIKLLINFIEEKHINSPLKMMENDKKEKQTLAEESIQNNDSVKAFINRLDGKIVDGSIKPAK